MASPQQPSLWDFVRFRTPRKRQKAQAEPRRPVAVTPVEKPLSEKTLPAMGTLVRVLGSDADAQRYHIVGVMLCGETCRVLLRKEGVTDGPMAQAVVEALTLA